LTAPDELLTHNQSSTGIGRWLKGVYRAAKASDHLQTNGNKMDPEKVVDWLLR